MCIRDRYNNEICHYPQLYQWRSRQELLLTLIYWCINRRYIRYIFCFAKSPVNLLASKLDCYCLNSPLSLAPRALSISTPHLWALQAGRHAACPWEEEASLGCCRWLSTWLFQAVAYQYHNRIKPDCSDDLIYIGACCLRDHIVSPRDNNLISRAGSEAQYVQLLGLYFYATQCKPEAISIASEIFSIH